MPGAGEAAREQPATAEETAVVEDQAVEPATEVAATDEAAQEPREDSIAEQNAAAEPATEEQIIDITTATLDDAAKAENNIDEAAATDS